MMTQVGEFTGMWVNVVGWSLMFLRRLGDFVDGTNCLLFSHPCGWNMDGTFMARV